jgi:multidrug transporter EmrE-like cation transporter
MTFGGFLLLFVTGCCGAMANILMKKGISQAGNFVPAVSGLFRLARQPAFLGGFLLVGISGLMWFRVLATQKLSTCYPLFVSITYFLITLGAFYFLHEKISIQKIAGLVVIVLGIVAVARG